MRVDPSDSEAPRSEPPRPEPRGRRIRAKSEGEPARFGPPRPLPDSARPIPEPNPTPEFEVVGGASDERPALLKLAHWLADDASEWCRDRSWEIRAPLVLLFLYILVRSVVEEEYTNFLFGGINLGFHEAGHALFRIFGEFMMIAGGTILQCLIPLIAAVALWRTQRDYFGVAFCLAWFGTNAFGCAIYASDARGQRNLALVSPWGQSFGQDGNGDWTRMLSRLGMLDWDTKIAFLFNCVGVVAFLLAIALAAWLMWRMHATRSEARPPPPEWAT